MPAKVVRGHNVRTVTRKLAHDACFAHASAGRQHKDAMRCEAALDPFVECLERP